MIFVRYRHRHSKHLLLHLKLKIATKFKEAFLECNFSTSLLIHELPPYAVQPKSPDMERNTSPIHANAKRLIKAIRSSKKERNNCFHFHARRYHLCVQMVISLITLHEMLHVQQGNALHAQICRWILRKSFSRLKLLFLVANKNNRKLKTNKASGSKKIYVHYILKKWLSRWQSKVQKLH